MIPLEVSAHSALLTTSENMSQNKKEVFPQQRLEKLFSSNRDLTLGRSNQRSQTNKKSFAPNLVKKDRTAPAKNDFEKAENERETNQRNNNRKDGPKGKRFNQANSKLVQTMGFLSEGIAVTQRKGYGKIYLYALIIAYMLISNHFRFNK